MSLWRKEAFDSLPEFRKELQCEKSFYLFLSFLSDQLEIATQKRNDDLIRRIYHYIDRLANAHRGPDTDSDLLTAVVVCFWEHLPLHAASRQDIGRWVHRDRIESLREAFLYHGSQEQYDEMIASANAHEKWSVPKK